MKMTNAKDIESKDAPELLGDGTGVAAFAPLDNSGAPAPAVGDKPVIIQTQNAKLLIFLHPFFFL